MPNRPPSEYWIEAVDGNLEVRPNPEYVAPIPTAMNDAMSDALFESGLRRGSDPVQLSCQFCGARPGRPCVNPDGSAYHRDDHHYDLHESRLRAFVRLPDRDQHAADDAHA